MVRDFGRIHRFPALAEDVPELFAGAPTEELQLHPGVPFTQLYADLLALEPNADTYLFCLGTLLRSRLKYERILQAQPLPGIDQVGPRGLLQYGTMKATALAALLFWRKWIFDVDNRAGQETGYLFEPIVSHAIGGVPFGARNSPIRRQGTGSGRQVDCVRTRQGERLAYEIKIRVTIAASGQGRWGEELSFPEDCRASGYKPILIVFDPTDNEKLRSLCRAFENVGGETFVGQQAWEHLEAEAGDPLDRFLEKYVRSPIQRLLEVAPDVLPSIKFSITDEQLRIEVAQDTLVVTRDGADMGGG